MNRSFAISLISLILVFSIQLNLYSQENGWVVLNLKSHVYHSPSCRHAENCKNCNVIEYNKITKNDRPCKACGGKPEVIEIMNKQKNMQTPQTIRLSSESQYHQKTQINPDNIQNVSNDISKIFSKPFIGSFYFDNNHTDKLIVTSEANQIIITKANKRYVAENINYKPYDQTIKFCISHNDIDCGMKFSGRLINSKISGDAYDQKGIKYKWNVNRIEPFTSNQAPVKVATKPVSPQTIPSKHVPQNMMNAKCCVLNVVPYRLKSRRFKKKFSGYRVFVRNQCPGDIRIIRAEVINGFNGGQAYGMQHKDPARSFFLMGKYSWQFTKKWNREARNEAYLFKNYLNKTTLTPGTFLETKTLTFKEEKPNIVVTYKDLKTRQVYTTTY